MSGAMVNPTRETARGESRIGDKINELRAMRLELEETVAGLITNINPVLRQDHETMKESGTMDRDNVSDINPDSELLQTLEAERRALGSLIQKVNAIRERLQL